MITRSRVGSLPNGSSVESIGLCLPNGFSATVLSWGATLQSVLAPDMHGQLAPVVLGYACIADYQAAPGRMGATMGRYANRIADARFELDGIAHPLPRNEGRHAIHGGPEGFDRRPWHVEEVADAPGSPHVRLRLHSADGDQGFPGAMVVDVTYAVQPPGDLVITYEARTTKPTVLNLTNHAYFNLAGEGSGGVLDHELTIAANRFLPVDEDLIPTGELRDVRGTAFDFLERKPLGRDIRSDDLQIRLGRGYDHCYVLSDAGPCLRPRFAASVFEPRSGRRMDLLTTEPGLQLHSGNVLTGRYAGASGKTYRQSDGFCLETQRFPNAPNTPHFPNTVLRPDQVYRSTTIHRFAVTQPD